MRKSIGKNEWRKRKEKKRREEKRREEKKVAGDVGHISIGCGHQLVRKGLA
jgi:hypothetical protein